MEEISIPNSQRGIMGPLTLQSPHWNALTPVTLDAFHLVNDQELIKEF